MLAKSVRSDQCWDSGNGRAVISMLGRVSAPKEVMGGEKGSIEYAQEKE